MSDIFGAGQAVSGVAQAAGSVAAAGIQAGAISDAASKAQQAANKSQDLLQGRYDTTRGDLLPYNQTGQGAFGQIAANAGMYGSPNNAYLDQANNFIASSQAYANQAQDQSAAAQRLGQGPAGQAALEATPGYQFTLAQGLQANQNAMAAKGLGVSGAAMKGAATFATGLADQTYGQQFNRLMQGANFVAGTGATYAGLADRSYNQNTGLQGNIQNSFNRLLGTAGIGENAAAQTGNAGATLGGAQAGAINAGGAAGAAGSIATGNALAGGANGIANSISQGNQLAQFQQQQNQGGINGAAGVNGLTQTDSSGNTSFF